MEINAWKAVAEGLIFASGDEGISKKQLSQVLEVPVDSVDLIIDELVYDYENTERGIMLMHSHDTYYMVTKPEHGPYHQKLLETPRSGKLSQAALETLAIIAYKQPVTRTEIEEIRGVKSDHAVRTLLARSLIEETGRKDSVGRPALFSTNTDFLTYFGLTSLEELPPLRENMEDEASWEEADLFFQDKSDAGDLPD